MRHVMDWTDFEDIAILLFENNAEMNPLDVRFTDLHRMVTSLPDFTGDPQASSEKKLEAIQMAWLEEFEDG